MLRFLSCASIYVIYEVAVVASVANIVNNGYRGVVVAINPEVPEDTLLIDAIKAVFTNASSDLFVATKRRAYYDKVTILVPKTWSGIYNPATSETYDSADVLVAAPNPMFHHQPYTLQYGDCGHPATYIHLTPDYIKNDVFVSDFGPKGKTVVHEWAHYRWGVFDETYTTGYNPFYFDSNGNVAATKCPASMVGVNKVIDYSSGSSRDCGKNWENGLPEDGCLFFPYAEQPNGMEVSIMSHQYMDKIVTFCHSNSADPVNVHNAEAQNEHNRLCSLRSTWEVIMQSPDFANGANQPAAGSTETRPDFNVVQVEASSRYVLVLDTSGSMENGRIEQMGQVVSIFIEQFVYDGDKVAIIEFNDKAHVLSDLVLINSKADRDGLLGSIPTKPDGRTCIGCGIQSAIEVLENGDKVASGGNIIVFTDGAENEDPRVKDVRQEVLNKDVIVHAIFFATDANDDLQDLVTDTNGIWFFGSDTNIQSILGAFQTLSAKDDGDVFSETFQVHSSTFTLGPFETYTNDVFVDSTVGNSSVFTFTWSQYDIPINVVLEAPSGCEYSTNPLVQSHSCQGHPLSTTDKNFNVVTFPLPGTAQIGRWRYYVSTSTGYTQTITATVTSQASDRNKAPVLVTSGLDRTNAGTGDAVVVYAQVSQGYLPVLGANVTARIEKPDGTAEDVDLFDAGGAPDVRRDDGIYSRYFIGYNNQGRYSVQITVAKNDEVTRRVVHTISRANVNVGTAQQDGSVVVNQNAGDYFDSVPSSDIGEFSRVITSEGFSYSGKPVTEKDDFFPPSKVFDLQASQGQTEGHQRAIVLSFTAPGSDYDVGRASSYEIRYMINNASYLVANYEDCMRVDNETLLEGNLTLPLVAGRQEQFFVLPPSAPKEAKISFAMRAADQNFNLAEISNVATMTFNAATSLSIIKQVLAVASFIAIALSL